MSTTAPAPVEAPDAPQLPLDLFREVHKGLRRALFDTTTAIGAADLRSADERDAILDRVDALIALLHHHHAHEDTHIQPHLVGCDPALAAVVDEGHRETDEGILELEQDAHRLRLAAGEGAVVAGPDLYRRLALFTAHYLAHMALEEGGVMDALRSGRTDDELLAVEMGLRGAVPPPLMCDFIAVMVPAMNRAERASMLGGMHAGAPAEIFELFRASAEAALTQEAYAVLAGDIDIA